MINKNKNILKLPSLTSKNIKVTEEKYVKFNDINSNDKYCRTVENKKTKFRRKSINLPSFKFNQKDDDLKEKDNCLFIKKKTLNEKMNIDKNMNKLIINNKKNKFFKTWKTKLKNNCFNYSESIRLQEKSIKGEIESSLIFIEKKINHWMSEASTKLNTSNNDLIINNNEEEEKTKKIIEKQTKKMSIDLLKKNFSLTEFSFIYFKYHKGNLV